MLKSRPQGHRTMAEDTVLELGMTTLDRNLQNSLTHLNFVISEQISATAACNIVMSPPLG